MADWEDFDTKEIDEIKVNKPVEDAIDTEAIERAEKERKKIEEENKKKKEQQAQEEQKKKKHHQKQIVSSDPFNQNYDSSVITKLKEKARAANEVKDLFDGQTHEYVDILDKIQLKKIDDFEILGQLLGHKLSDPDFFQIHIEEFLNKLLESLYDKVTSKEYQQVSTKLTVLLQRKQREEKAGTKKTKAKGPTVKATKNTVARNNDAEGSNSEGSGDGLNYKANFNEDDFM